MSEDPPFSLEHGELLKPTFKDVVALTPQMVKTQRGLERLTDSTMYALSLTSGELDLRKTPEIPQLQPNERLLVYIRTEDEMVRIEEGGKTVKQIRFEIPYGSSKPKVDTFYGFGVIGSVALGEPLKALLNVFDTNADLPYNSRRNPLSKLYTWPIKTTKPVTEVLIRTSRPVLKDSFLSVTDTPVLFQGLQPTNY